MATTLKIPEDIIKASGLTERECLVELAVHLYAERRIKLPLVQCAHEARPGEEMNPERVTRVLLEEESVTRRGALR